MALRPADLGVPGFVGVSAYVSREPLSPTYIQEIETACKKDQPAAVSLQLTRLPDDALARRVYRMTLRQLTPGLRPRAIVGGSAGFVRSARVTRLPSRVHGVTSRVFLTRTGGPLGPSVQALAVARIRRVVAVLSISGRGDGRIATHQTDRLLTILDRRVRAELRSRN
jgi:hypothetical protein